MFDILSTIPAKKRHSSSGWVTFNCIACVHNGHNADKRNRAGVKFDSPQTWRYHCFNCGFTCGFTLGKPITTKTRQLLGYCGIDKEQIQRWNLESLAKRDLMEVLVSSPENKPIYFLPRELPQGAELLREDNPQHKVWVDYIHTRGLTANDYNFYVTPNEHGRNRNRVIIPYLYRGEIVGHTSRFCDNRTPKYLNVQQHGYVFGMDLQRPQWNVAIVVEGIFDALSINGLALMHNTISTQQHRLINTLNRRVIVVPDMDSAGDELCEAALQHGWSVSIPNWHSDIKDVNDAVIRYGRLQTLLSILQSATTSRIKVELFRRKLRAK